MIIRQFVIHLALIGLVFGCSTVRVSQDYEPSVDFGGLRSFAWQYDNQPQTGDIRLDNSLTDGRIRRAVELHLVSAGFAKADRSEADLLVAYQLGIQQKIQSDDINTRFGFGFGSRGHFGGIAIGTGSDVRSYDEGLLLIDVLAPGDGRLLWRGKGTDSWPEHADPEQATRQLNEMVQKIMAQFPPAGS